MMQAASEPAGVVAASGGNPAPPGATPAAARRGGRDLRAPVAVAGQDRAHPRVRRRLVVGRERCRRARRERCVDGASGASAVHVDSAQTRRTGTLAPRARAAGAGARHAARRRRRRRLIGGSPRCYAPLLSSRRARRTPTLVRRAPRRRPVHARGRRHRAAGRLAARSAGSRTGRSTCSTASGHVVHRCGGPGALRRDGACAGSGLGRRRARRVV